MLHIRRRLWTLLLLASLPVLSTAQSPEGLLVGAPDPTAVATRDAAGNTVYYVAATGPGVQLLRSTDLVHWERAGRVFAEDVPDWARREVPGTKGIWAPDLSYHDGLYYLYYSVSTFGSQQSVIGLAVNRSLDPASAEYVWEDRGKVVESSRQATNFNAIDPALLVDQQGRWHLSGARTGRGSRSWRSIPRRGSPDPVPRFSPLPPDRGRNLPRSKARFPSSTTATTTCSSRGTAAATEPGARTK